MRIDFIFRLEDTYFCVEHFGFLGAFCGVAFNVCVRASAGELSVFCDQILAKDLVNTALLTHKGSRLRLYQDSAHAPHICSTHLDTEKGHLLFSALTSK